MSAVLRQYEPRESGLPHLDKTGDFVYELQEAEDRIVASLRKSIYGPHAHGHAWIGNKLCRADEVLHEATDIDKAPCIEVFAYLIERSRLYDPAASALVDRLINAYAKANAEVE